MLHRYRNDTITDALSFFSAAFCRALSNGAGRKKEQAVARQDDDEEIVGQLIWRARPYAYLCAAIGFLLVVLAFAISRLA